MKYALDTNVFIDGFRNEKAQSEVLAFLNRAIPFTYLSAVVMQELAAGARTADAARDLQERIFTPFERRRRVFIPSAGAFVAGGRVVASIAAKEGWAIVAESPSLANDALIATSCREQGITLITNDGDFNRIAPFVSGLSYIAPWPTVREGRG